jgi:molybdate transport system ATP-binding protein
MTFSFSARLEDRGLDVDLELQPGETLALLGPNGAGKSSLLAILAGLLRPDAGAAELNGRTLFDLNSGRQLWIPPFRRRITLLAQEALLFPHLTALDNVAFGPRSRGATRARSRTTARDLLRQVDAGSLERRRPHQLSGGQAQRVALARALAATPELLLLDEPLAALDIHAAALLRRLLKQVLAGRRAILVTHDVLDAFMLADRVAVLESGRVVEAGPTRQVLDRPRSGFAAGLAGLNLITGTVTRRGLTSRDRGEVAGQVDEGAAAGGAGVAVFPPSAVSVFLTPPVGSPRNGFRVTVTDLEPHGDQIRVRAGDLSADITPGAAADLSLAPGVGVWFVVKAAEVSVYPA